MESRVLVLFLIALTALFVGGCARQRTIAGDPDRPPVIEPDIERRDIEPAKIDTEDFEIGIYAGTLSVEDFGVNTVVGANFSYHITENLFLDVGAGTSETSRTSFEVL
ncbi:MAG: outer membrane beta-barrel domain-containing protein, partial [Gammaproteobacteria bacterium]